MSQQIYRTFLSVSLAALAWFSQSFVCAGDAAIGAGSTGAVECSPASPAQGETLVVTMVGTADSQPPSLGFHHKNYKFFPVADGDPNGAAMYMYRALIGVPADLPPGRYPLTIGDTTRELVVHAGGFGVQKIRLSKEKDNFISSPGEEEAVDKAKATVSPTQLWTGKFVRPSSARVSTTFGLRRMVNGRLLADYFHSGIDYAGALGTPVKAAQRGRVILAHQGWRLHGNIVALDHGQGVITFYLHLSKILVKDGDIVEAGQEIGKVGATGRATGPHLHFSMYVNGDATNPLDWMTRTI